MRLNLTAPAVVGLAVAGVYAALFLSISARLPEHHWLAGDEEHFVETIRGFAADPSLERLRTYEEMSTPGPFVLYALWARSFGDGIVSLRLANFLVALLACLTVAELFRVTTGPPIGVWLALWFALFPYTLYLSLFVYTDMPAMACLALGYLAVVRNRPTLACFGFAGALLCRQYLVFALVGLGCEAIACGWQGQTRQALRLLAVCVIASLPLAGLVLLWGGLTPDNQLQHLYLSTRTEFHGRSLLLYLAIAPWFVGPVVWRCWSCALPTGRVALAALLAGFVAMGLWPIAPSPSSVVAGISTVGLFHRAIQTIAGMTWWEHIPFALGLAFSLMDVPAQIRAVRARAGGERIWVFQWWAFLLIMPWSYLHWEKYLLPVLPVLMIWGSRMRRANGD